MDMHQAGKQAEWASIPEAELHGWQQLAARTNGWVTPGNMISVAGLLLVLAGLLILLQGHYLLSFLLVVVGRFADLLDGIVAHKTHTKSPVGEAVDAGVDKIELLVAVVIMLALETAPAMMLGIIIVTNVCIALISALAKLKKRHLHPVRTGKLATFILWVALGLYIGFAASKIHAIANVAGLLLALAVILGFIALAKYLLHFIRSTPPDIADD